MRRSGARRTSLLDRILPRTGCDGKVRITDYRQAVEITAAYNARVVLQFGEFGPYWCRRHHAWHVGHRGKRDALRAVVAGWLMPAR